MKKLKVAPKVTDRSDGPFGKIYPEDRGFTTREWGSIPPLPHARNDHPKNRLCFNGEALDINLRYFLPKIIKDPSCFSELDIGVQDALIILNYGYVEGGNSALQEALKYRSKGVQRLWKEMVMKKTWRKVITECFPLLPQEDREDIIDFYKTMGLPCPQDTLHQRASARWSYMAVDCDGYVGGCWSVRNPCITSA